MGTPTILPALILAVLPASADVLNFALTPAVLGAPAGQATTLEFTGTLSNPTTGDVFLNGDLSVLEPTLTLDDSPFFTFSPLFLPGGGAYTGPFFDVLVGPSILPGSYSGSFIIQGGADAMAFENLATQDFTVDVVATTVPEPGFPTAVPAALLMLVKYLLRRAPEPQARARRPRKGRHSGSVIAARSLMLHVWRHAIVPAVVRSPLPARSASSISDSSTCCSVSSTIRFQHALFCQHLPQLLCKDSSFRVILLSGHAVTFLSSVAN